MSDNWDLKICCMGAGYVGGPTMAVIAKRCPKVSRAREKRVMDIFGTSGIGSFHRVSDADSSERISSFALIFVSKIPRLRKY